MADLNPRNDADTQKANEGLGIVTELVLGGPGDGRSWLGLQPEKYSALTVARASLPGSPFSKHIVAVHLTLTSPGHTVWRLLRGKTGVAAS